jgi:predicted O-linked N-acetylglucosamine transferase (SPINDLY family)
LASQHFLQGFEEHRRGRLTQAEALYRRAIELEPQRAELVNNLGHVLQDLGRLEEAVNAYRQAVALKPDFALAHVNLGAALGALKRPQEAVAAYRQALAHLRNNAELHCHLGNALNALGRRDEAVACYRRAIALSPSHGDAHAKLGASLRDAGKLTEAAAVFRRACTIVPDSAEAWNDLGLTHHALDELDDAIAAHRRAVALRPDFAEAQNNLGVALRASGRAQDAVAAYRQAVAAKPDSTTMRRNLGIACLEAGRLEEAEASFRQVLALDPSDAEAYNSLGLALQSQGKLEAAAACYAEALALRPDFFRALGSLAYVRRALCDWQDAARDAERCRAGVRAGQAGQDPLAFMSLDPAPDEQLRCARLWTQAMTQAVVPLPPRAAQRAGGKIRLGYLSADFRQHSVSVLTAELFERHDRDRFELFAYSAAPDDGGPLRRRLAQAFDQFIDIAPLSNRDAAQRIRADGVDILVDLSGHTKGGRVPILAARPAPVQVNFLGYAGSMGAPFLDYVIADPIVAPLADQPFYDETIVHLPDTYMPFDTTTEIAAAMPSRAQCGLPETGFVFCCFNVVQKIAPAMFDVWMRLLRAVPDSVLWLATENATVRANLRREAEARGVAGDRVVFAAIEPLPLHLARHRLADLFLDTLPYNACTTAGLSLWAGLPVLTCVGGAFVGRIAASLLHAAGLDELVTHSLASYEARALALAAAPARLAALRCGLAAARRTAPLFDAARYARNLEAAYARMWARWTEGRPPEPFAL